MKEFFDTAGVFLANILRLRPTSWSESKKLAVAMRKAHLAFKPSKVTVDGKEEDTVRDLSPLGYFGDALLNALGFVTAVWLIHQVVIGFLALLPFLFGLALFGLALHYFGFGGKPIEQSV